MKRQSGVLMHITSLNNDEGIGTLGDEAFEFIDWLCRAKIGIWQMLPIGPTGYGDSPYASFSAFAGNPYLISINQLRKEQLVSEADFSEYKQIIKKHSKPDRVDYGLISWYKTALLEKIAEGIYSRSENDFDLKNKLNSFYEAENFWLDDYAVFMAIKNFYDKKAEAEKSSKGIWNEVWDKNLASYDKASIEEFSKTNFKQIELNKIIQFLFFEQWAKLKNYAKEKNIKLIGDIPIFVAADSADIWANQNLFLLERNGEKVFPSAVAGVPPDFFSTTGQLWGNPLYDWDKMEEDNYCWWLARFRQMLKFFDIIRIDHFRGFEAFWAIPPGSENAVNGRWMPGPNHKLFEAVKNDLAQLNESYKNELPIIAEDLGVITDEVIRLRDDFNFPGMKILQFAFDINEWNRGELKNPYLPHNIYQNCVVYTGSHDNDTMLGSLEHYSKERFEFVYAYIHGKPASEADYKKFQTEKGIREFSDEILRLCFSTRADLAIVQMQDILYEGYDAKMNSPSTIGGNWQWRQKHLPPEETTERLALWNVLYARI